MDQQQCRPPEYQKFIINQVTSIIGQNRTFLIKKCFHPLMLPESSKTWPGNDPIDEYLLTDILVL